jgi:hypothetical protein
MERLVQLNVKFLHGLTGHLAHSHAEKDEEQEQERKPFQRGLMGHVLNFLQMKHVEHLVLSTASLLIGLLGRVVHSHVEEQQCELAHVP